MSLISVRTVKLVHVALSRGRRGGGKGRETESARAREGGRERGGRERQSKRSVCEREIGRARAREREREREREGTEREESESETRRQEPDLRFIRVQAESVEWR